MSRLPKQRIPCIIRISNLGVHFGKNKCALYTGKYGTFIPQPVLLRYIVDYKEKYIHTIKAADKNVLSKFIECRNTG